MRLRPARLADMDTTMTWPAAVIVAATVLVAPVAAARWAQLVGTDLITEPLRHLLATLRLGRFRVGQWIVDGWVCTGCATLQFVTVAAVTATIGWAWWKPATTVAVVTVWILAVGYAAQLAALLLATRKHVAQARLDAAANTDTAPTVDVPLLAVTATHNDGDRVDIVVQPVTETDLYALPAAIGDISYVADVHPVAPVDGWEPVGHTAPVVPPIA